MGRLGSTKKGVMDRLAPLSMQQRLDFQVLLNRGVPEVEARAIAQGYQLAKADAPARGPGDAYYKAFHQAAKRLLPDWQHSMLHKTARGKAGAAGAARKREGKAALLGELEALGKRMAQLQAEIGKSSPLASEVHVPVPMGGKKKRFEVIKAATLGMTATELAYIKGAYGLQVPTEAPVPDDAEGELSPELDQLLQANRLVAGMDMELQGGASSAEEARRRASRALLERPGYYDGVGAEPDVRPLRGLLLDIGSGTQRAPGHLGLDIYPYDHGTVLQDVELGLPFPEGSVRAIRLHHSLHAILDAPGARPDPVPLLQECQRVLMEGGCLYYDGPEPLVEDGQRWPLPGLVLLRGQGTAQVLRRVPLRVPAYPGADAIYAPAAPMPIDMQMALAAANTAPAETAMANLVRKSLKRVVPIAKADKMRQIITGVILSPHEADLQDDVISPEEIERSAHDYLIRSRIVGSEHGKPIDAGVVESYIAPQDLKFTGLDGDNTFVAKGSWVMSVKVTDPEEWAQVLAGSYTGFSVGGFGEREPMQAA